MTRKADNVTRTGVLIALLFLLVQAFLAATAGFADLHSIAAHKLLHEEKSSTTLMSREKLGRVIAMQENATRLSSLNADYQLDLALLYQSYPETPATTGERQAAQTAAEH
ncbi:hypothetical protein BOV90_10190, partial [Solemya velum gill symbiont]